MESSLVQCLMNRRTQTRKPLFSPGHHKQTEKWKIWQGDKHSSPNTTTNTRDLPTLFRRRCRINETLSTRNLSVEERHGHITARWEILCSGNAWQRDIQKELLPPGENQRESWRLDDTGRNTCEIYWGRLITNQDHMRSIPYRNTKHLWHHQRTSYSCIQEFSTATAHQNATSLSIGLHDNVNSILNSLQIGLRWYKDYIQRTFISVLFFY